MRIASDIVSEVNCARWRFELCLLLYTIEIIFPRFIAVFCSTEETTIMDYGGKLAYDND